MISNHVILMINEKNVFRKDCIVVIVNKTAGYAAYLNLFALFSFTFAVAKACVSSRVVQGKF